MISYWVQSILNGLIESAFTIVLRILEKALVEVRSLFSIFKLQSCTFETREYD